MSVPSDVQQDMIPSLSGESQGIPLRIGIRREIGLIQAGVNPLQIMEEDIDELKQQLEEKDMELAKLRKKVKDLEESNNNLTIKLEAKDEEVKRLKERIKNLEDDKKSLQQELASVQYKLKTVEDDVKKLTEGRDSDQEKYVKLEEKFKEIQYTLKGIVEDLQTTKDENKKLTHELKQVRHQSRYVSGAPMLMPVKASEDAKASTNLGEMSLQIQDALYQRVLPDFFTPIRSYKVATLKKDIEKLCKTEKEKAQALQRWEDLKTKLPLKGEDLEEALDALQDTYKRCVDTNPPKLSAKALKDSAELLERQRILKGWIAPERVNGLIDIWKSLVECGEKA